MQNNQPSFNIWQLKPWWCQPWSILLTGITLIGATWWFFHRIWFTSFVALPVLTWMFYFLRVYPKLMQTMMAGEADRTEP